MLFFNLLVIHLLDDRPQKVFFSRAAHTGKAFSAMTNGLANLKRVLIGVFGVTISIAALIYVFHDVDFEQLLACKNRIKWIPLLASVVIYWTCLVVLRSLLVKYLLSKVGNVKLLRAYRCLSIGYFVNNILPFRMGDIARSGAIAKGSALRFSTVIGGMAIERIMDMVMVAIIAFISIQLAPVPKEIRIAAFISSVFFIVIFIVLIFFAQKNFQEIEATSQNKVKVFVWNLWVRFSSGFAALGSARGILVVVILSLAIWICALAVMMLRLAAFDLPYTITNSLVLLTCLGFGVAIPSAPGYVGVYQAAVAFALGLFGIEPVVAAAFGLFSWIIDVSAGNIIGAISMWFEGMKFSDIKRNTSIS